jgi:tetratricopeptide (TPR) repeat protein
MGTMGKIVQFNVSLFTLLIVLLPMFNHQSTCPSANGLPGEYILSNQWRTFSVYYSPLTNPALISDQDFKNIRAAACFSPDNSADLYEFAASIPIGLFNTIGISMMIEKGKNIEGGIMHDNGAYVTDTIRGSVSNKNMLLTASYATNRLNRLSMGLNCNLLSQGNFGNPVYGLGLDMGLTFRLANHPAWGNHLLGLAYKNIIRPSFDTYTDDTEIKYPVEASLLYNVELLQEKLIINGQFDITDFITQAKLFKNNHRRVEWNFKTHFIYTLFSTLSLKAFTQFSQTRQIDFWGFSSGLNLPYVNKGRDFEISYQYRNEINDFVNVSHSVYLKMDIGEHRENIFSKRIKNSADFLVNDLYTKAMESYSQEKYWDALLIFRQISSQYPEFFKNDLVSYFTAQCLEDLDMRESADEFYKQTITKYPSGKTNGLANLGRMRIAYRQASYDQVTHLFDELNKPAVSDSIRQHALYIMGETELRKGQYSIAKEYFLLIPPEHPDYVFAQNSFASALAFNNSDTKQIINALEMCVAADPVSLAGKEIVNRAKVLLGYNYYEQNQLADAASYLQTVPQSSYYYNDALLGQGWIAIKAHQWDDCKLYGRILSGHSENMVVKCEGTMMVCYALMMEKKYAEADTLLTLAIRNIQNYIEINLDSMNRKQIIYDTTRKNYLQLSGEVLEIAKKGLSRNTKEIRSLHNKQTKMKKEIDSFLKFVTEFKRVAFFSGNASDVLNDLEYLNAKLHQIMIKKASPVSDYSDKNVLNDKIARLKKEIRDIE